MGLPQVAVCVGRCVCAFFFIYVYLCCLCVLLCVCTIFCVHVSVCVCVYARLCVCEWSKLVSVLASGVLYPLDSSPPPRLSQSGTGGVPVWPLETPRLTSSYTTRRLLAGGTAISNANKHGRHCIQYAGLNIFQCMLKNKERNEKKKKKESHTERKKVVGVK